MYKAGDYKKPADMVIKMCENENASKFDRFLGCNFAAQFYQKGQGVPKDEAKMFEYYKKACDINKHS